MNVHSLHIHQDHRLCGCLDVISCKQYNTACQNIFFSNYNNVFANMFLSKCFHFKINKTPPQHYDNHTLFFLRTNFLLK